MKIQRQLSNGTMWQDETDQNRINNFIDMVIERDIWVAPRAKRASMTTRQEVIDYLATGKTIKYDNDFYTQIRDADAIKQPVNQPAKMVRADCGHTVSATQVMSTSGGTSCPDCHDRMSR